MNRRMILTLSVFIVSSLICIVAFYLIGFMAADGIARMDHRAPIKWYAVGPGNFWWGLKFLILFGLPGLLAQAAVAVTFLTCFVSGLLLLVPAIGALGKRTALVLLALVLVLVVLPLAGNLMRGNEVPGARTGDPNAMVNIEGAVSTSALGAAIGSGDREKIQAFLDRGASLQAPIKWMAPPGSEPRECSTSVLMLGVGAVAAGKAETDFLQYLIEHGADVNCGDTLGNFPLVSASTFERLSQTGDVVKLLLNNGANPNVRFQDVTALFVAATRGYQTVAEALIERGADVNARSEGKTPLSAARAKGQMNMVQLLLQHGGTE